MQRYKISHSKFIKNNPASINHFKDISLLYYMSALCTLTRSHWLLLENVPNCCLSIAELKGPAEFWVWKRKTGCKRPFEEWGLLVKCRKTSEEQAGNGVDSLCANSIVDIFRRLSPFLTFKPHSEYCVTLRLKYRKTWELP